MSPTPVASLDHYENFPVASLLVPRRQRRSVAAIYRFARSADDRAGEGAPTPAQRLAPGAATFTTTHAGIIRWDSAREDTLSYYVDGAKQWTFRPAAILKDCRPTAPR